VPRNKCIENNTLFIITCTVLVVPVLVLVLVLVTIGITVSVIFYSTRTVYQLLLDFVLPVSVPKPLSLLKCSSFAFAVLLGA
jgi:hypothetical protein